ncbi:DUF416 family protein [Microcoleus sp. F6_B4]
MDGEKMQLNFFDFSFLETELEFIPSFHRLAFAASICERLLPNYNAFSKIEKFGNFRVLRQTLDEIWQFLQNNSVNRTRVPQLIYDCDSDLIIPHADDFGAGYALEAQEAAFALCNTLEACLNPTPKAILKVAEHATNTIDAFINFDETFSLLQSQDITKYKQVVANHRLAVREMAKQTEDLRRLKEIEILDREILEWLRTSSYNGGRSLIDLS